MATSRLGRGARAAVELRSASPAATFTLGERLAAVAAPGDLVCLWGELGAGKTILAKGFARGLGIAGTVSSPSFILMAEYPGRLRLFHLDLYRLADASEAVAGGLLDERQVDGVTIVEWPDRLASTLPPERLDVRIEGTGDEVRAIRLETPSRSMARYLKAAAAEGAGPEDASARGAVAGKAAP